MAVRITKVSALTEVETLARQLYLALRSLSQSIFLVTVGLDTRTAADLTAMADIAREGLSLSLADYIRKLTIELSVKLFGDENTYKYALEMLALPRGQFAFLQRLVAFFSPSLELSYRNSRTRLGNIILQMEEEVFSTSLVPDKNVEVMVVEQSIMSEVSSMDKRAVMVVHGRDNKARNALFAFLRALGLRPIEWSQALRDTGKGSPHISDVLDAAFTRAQAVVVLFTPDDVAQLHERLWTEHEPSYEKTPTGQARPNVLFEAGLAFGRHPNRTILVEVGALRPFSDIAGMHVIRMNGSSEKRHDLASRLQTAGCDVDASGTDWLREGDFTVTP